MTGITLSEEQKAYAEKWIDEEGLSEKISINILNYRDLGHEQFDKISCIGMSEHVGAAHMNHFFDRVSDSLKIGGLFLQHTITANYHCKKGHENKFLDKYMFPGGELMTEADLVHLGCDSGFELLSAENFRTHYVRTLDDWISAMEACREGLQKVVSEKTNRIYHVFFIGSMIAFKQNEISLFQNLFYKTDENCWDTERFLSPYSKNETRLS